jgi:hypothetical protein
MMKNPQLLTEVRQPEPIKNLVQSIPVKDGMKLSETNSILHKSNQISWEDIRGLGWVFYEDWS